MTGLLPDGRKQKRESPLPLARYSRSTTQAQLAQAERLIRDQTPARREALWQEAAQKITHKNANGGDRVTNGQASSLTDSAAQWFK
jgi:hypothetical protein